MSINCEMTVRLMDIAIRQHDEAGEPVLSGARARATRARITLLRPVKIVDCPKPSRHRDINEEIDAERHS
jgi:hypothetical protein